MFSAQNRLFYFVYFSLNAQEHTRTRETTLPKSQLITHTKEVHQTLNHTCN